ncbi:asparaginase domain-containing protein [Hoeflea prorocentri]|uniref:Asparaginase domain-containing protein n=1 Tax=Hoeflea prorocentri TaxID=1922333 RepID=A0A9X3UMI0_9HYPH|nr:asparaginase domain-containing protein [Hoeflea prorocentri]MCY6381919.1 asparaginase domain-containing protein [Hoeflea prorocentri]MDA5399719.1 asparaginase domain-containing protein [Hoeflea prorocentri]
MQKLLVVHTGGTIGMTRHSGAWVPTDEGRALVETSVARFSDQSGIDVAFRVATRQFDSSQARPEYWVALAREIRGLASDHCGVVLIHGTDTLSYAAAMLSFLLIGLDKPLVVTGSQRPLSLEGSDAGRNLQDALTVVTELEPGEIMVSFGGLVLVAERVRKTSSKSDQAFSTPGTRTVGKVSGGVFQRFDKRSSLSGRAPLKIDANKRPRLTSLVASPILDLPTMDGIAASKPSGLILELYGLGTIPVHERGMLEKLRRMTASGMRILAISQCCDGGLELSTYPSGRALLDQGVIDGKTLTRSAAVAKLWCALAEADEAPPHLIASRWRGEID